MAQTLGSRLQILFIKTLWPPKWMVPIPTSSPKSWFSLALGGNWQSLWERKGHVTGGWASGLENAISSPVFEMLPKECHSGAEVTTSQRQQRQSSPTPGRNPGEVSSRGHLGAAQGKENDWDGAEQLSRNGQKQRQAKTSPSEAQDWPCLPRKQLTDLPEQVEVQRKTRVPHRTQLSVCVVLRREKMPAHQATVTDATLLAFSLPAAHLPHGSDGCGLRSDVRRQHRLVR